VEDFYSRAVEANVEAARRLEPTIELAELAGNVLSHAGPAAEFAERYEPIRRQATLAAEELRDAQSLFSRVDVGGMRQLRATIQAFAESRPAANLERLMKPVRIDLGIAKANMPIFERLESEFLAGFRRVDWSSLTQMTTVTAVMQVLKTARIETAGVGVVALPKPSMSGVGEVVLPGGTNAWPAIAEQLQRIGTLPCGAIYAIVLVLVLIALQPKLAEDIGDAVLFVTVTNAIIRNGQR
jgi:hypothetical protein